MTKKLDDVMKGLPKKRRERIERRGEEIRADYLTLKELRRLCELTQKDLAKALKVTQENVSNVENRPDIMVSTLRNHIEAMGGELDITVKFPKRKPIRLAEFGTNTPSK